MPQGATTKATTTYRNFVGVPAVIDLTHSGMTSGARICERVSDECRTELVLPGGCLDRVINEPNDGQVDSPDRFEVRIKLADRVDRIGSGAPVRRNDLELQQLAKPGRAVQVQNPRTKKKREKQR